VAVIRVVFAELPRILRDILHQSLLTEPDVVLVGEAADLGELERIVERGEVDVVVLGHPDADLPASHYKLFDAGTRMRILAIADHGRLTSLYELRPHRVRLGDGSPKDLVQVIRDHVRVTSVAPTED
jgi:DNA-binding NarL/FixJ family response regulator